MIKCFEANYPESLGSVVVYKAPWVFNQIWRIIKGWLDPVVASKIHFAKTVDELELYVPRSRIMAELDGDEKWEYTYIEPVAGENKMMSEGAGKKEELETERRTDVRAFEKETIAWANASGGVDVGEGREGLKLKLRENYWRLDPFVRAKSHYDREGILGDGGKLDFYPGAVAATTTTSTTTTATVTQKMQETSIDDVE